jgi:hypothetical protein
MFSPTKYSSSDERTSERMADAAVAFPISAAMTA